MPKILYIGFGILSFAKGGAVVYQKSLAEGMHALGWGVVCFMGVPNYACSIRNKPYLKTQKSGEIKFIELYNSPNYPDCFNKPHKQCQDADIENLMRRILREESPDIVHFHELQMHTASIIDIAWERKIPCLKTMHNYYDICPQRDLMYKGREICLDFYGGSRCVECLDVLPVRELSFLKRSASILLPQRVYTPLSGMYKRFAGSKRIKDAAQNKSIPDSPRQYYQRRRFFVERLNKLNIIHCSSMRSAEIFKRYGVVKEKIKVIPLSLETIDLISPKPLRDAHFPVVFGYIGGRHFHKGYQALMEAFSKLDQKRAKLIVWNVPQLDESWRHLNIEIRKYYNPEELDRVFQDIDVGIVPSVWEEIFGLIGIEWLAGRIPVIGSNLGGIPEWLKDGENGFLVTPGDVGQLTEKMGSFVENPEMISHIQQRIMPQKAFASHVAEIAGLYQDSITLK